MSKLIMTAATKALVKLHSGSGHHRAEGVFYRSLLDQVGVHESTEIDALGWAEPKRVCVHTEKFPTLPDAEQVGLLAHEARHLYQGTISRANRVEKCQRVLYNVASDLTINEALLDGGFSLPSGEFEGVTLKSFDSQPKVKAALEKAFVVHKTTEEQVYHILKQTGAKVPEGFEPDLGDGSESDDGGDGSEDSSDIGTVESSMKIKVASALITAQKAGELPEYLARDIAVLLKESTPWPRKVRNWMQSFSDSDLSWKRPDMGLLSNFCMIMPDFWSESMGELVVVLDTSGSMTQEMLNAIAGHISAGLAEVKPEKLHVIYCDTAVNHVDTYDAPLSVEFKARGGGGTCFRPPFDYLEKKGIDPAGLIYFTDGYGDFPDQAPSYPVLWGVVDGGISDVPFGDYVGIDL